MNNNTTNNEEESSAGLSFVFFILLLIYLFTIYMDNYKNSKTNISELQRNNLVSFELELNKYISLNSFPEYLNVKGSDFIIPYNKLFLIELQKEISIIKSDDFISIKEYQHLSDKTKSLYKKDLILKENII